MAFVNSDEAGGNRFSTVISFERDAKKTKIQLKMSFATKEECDKVVKEYGAIEGNKQTFDKFEEYLEKTK